MSTRKIIDIEQNGEKVWPKGHAKATYMSDGSTVEDAINNIEIPSLDDYVTETELNDKGFLTEHQDISGKQDKLVDGVNIATINGQSLTIGGDIQIPISDNIYVTDFTMYDLEDIFYSEGEISKAVDIASLLVAAQANKIIIVPIAPETKLGCVANIDIYDENVELWLYYYNRRIEIRLSTTSQEIAFDNVWMEDNQPVLISGENIKTINGEDILGEGDMELATKEDLTSKADDSSVVHTTGDEIIYGTKEFTHTINANNGILFRNGGSINSYSDANGTTENVIGYIRQTCIVNNENYPLYLYGSVARPKYNDFEDIAFLSDVNGKQDALISGTNIKTINGESILGSGDINIEVGGPTLTESDIAAMGFTKNMGTVQSVETSETLDDVSGVTYVKYVAQTLTDAQKAQARSNIGAAAVGEGGGSSTGSINYPKISMDYWDLNGGIEPNKYYVFTNVTNEGLYINLEEPVDLNIVNEYVFEFYVEENTWIIGDAHLSLPADIKWANDTFPEIKADKTYVISIVNNLAVFVECSGRLN